MDTKKCTKCGQIKPVTDFYPHRVKYLQPSCKECQNAKSREYHHANRERRIKQISEYGKRSKYGISAAEYQSLVALQNGTCAICHGTCQTGRALAVDHDHVSGKVRGLLCGSCNNGLGRFKDSPDLLTRAIEYLGGSMTTKCGWCLCDDHRNCKPSVTYYDKTWECTCECRGSTPTTEEPVKKTRKTRSDKGKKRGPRTKKEGT